MKLNITNDEQAFLFIIAANRLLRYQETPDSYNKEILKLRKTIDAIQTKKTEEISSSQLCVLEGCINEYLMTILDNFNPDIDNPTESIFFLNTSERYMEVAKKLISKLATINNRGLKTKF